MDRVMPPKLTFPNKSHTLDDLQPYYERFKILHPDLFAIWRQHALSSRLDESDLSNEVYFTVIELIRANFEYDSETALISAFGDLGKLLYIELHGSLPSLSPDA
jgi:hypothetical protein